MSCEAARAHPHATEPRSTSFSNLEAGREYVRPSFRVPVVREPFGAGRPGIQIGSVITAGPKH